MPGLLDLPTEITLLIMNFAKWQRHKPDYESIKTWSLTCRILTPCAQSVLFSHVILRNISTMRALQRVVGNSSKTARYLRDRVRILEVFTKEELGARSIHLHDVAQLIPRLTNLRHLALDLDRFYTFTPVSLPLIRHASENLTAITVKPSCGWTLLQLLERLPNLRHIHYVDQFPNSSSFLNHRISCPIAFTQITYTSLSKYGFKPLLWLTSHPHLKLDLLELGSAVPDPLVFNLVMNNIGSHLRRLHVYNMTPTCMPFLAQCTVLEELIIGGPNWSTLFAVDFIPVSCRRIYIFGDNIFYLDYVFPVIFERLRSLSILNTLTFVGEDKSAPPFMSDAVERDWIRQCRSLGVQLSFLHVPGCHEMLHSRKSDECGVPSSMIRPSMVPIT